MKRLRQEDEREEFIKKNSDPRKSKAYYRIGSIVLFGLLFISATIALVTNRKEDNPLPAAESALYFKFAEPLNVSLLVDGNCSWADQYQLTGKVNVTAAQDITVDPWLFSHKYRNWFPYQHEAGNWMRISTTILWSEKYSIYLTFTRMAYRDDPKCADPCMWVKRSYVYVVPYDTNWKPVETTVVFGNQTYHFPDMLNIPFFNQTSYYAGPEDSRAYYDHWGNPNLIYNILDPTQRRVQQNFNLSSQIAQTYTYNNSILVEKNWITIIHPNKPESVFIVHTYEPFRLLECSLDTYICKAVTNATDGSKSAIRGGSGYTQWRDTNYFISFARSHADCPTQKNVYRLFFNILYIDPLNEDYRNVYFSEPIDLGRLPFAIKYSDFQSEKLKNFTLDEEHRVLTTTGMFPGTKDNDISYLIASVQDADSIVIELRGLDAAIETIVDAYESNSDRVTISSQTVYQCAMQSFDKFCNMTIPEVSSP